MIVRRTSPAKMLPNNRNESEIILPNSLIISRKPTNAAMGLFKEMNFPTCSRMPTMIKPNICESVTTTRASAMVMLRSEYTERKRGTNVSFPSCASRKPILPTPGNSRKKTKQSSHAAFYGGLNIPWRTLYPDEKDERTNDEKEHHKPRGKERVGYWKSSDMKKRFRSD